MRVVKTILSVILVLLALVMLAFAGFFLWSSLPKNQPEVPEALDMTDIFTPEEPPLPAPPAVEEPKEVPPVAEEPKAPEAEEPVKEEPVAEPPAPSSEKEAYRASAQNYLETMTLEEKVWQLFMATPESLTGVNLATRAGDATKTAIETQPVGGICYFAANLEDRVQTQELLGKSQSYAKTPMFLSVDEEGGLVSRAGSNQALGVTYFEAAAEYGKRADMSEVYGVGKTMAQELGELGFNLNFAPVADVITNPNNTEIGSRSYSEDPQIAGAMVAAMVQGLQRNGMLSCVKHFPGHGSTEADSHQGKSVSTRTLEELRATEWLPFTAGIQQDVAFVMVSHLTNENLSSLPADLSPEVISYLREELGFQGIIITDSHQMGAITETYTSGQAALLALEAGVDMILMPQDLKAAHQAVLDAIAAGTLPEARIDQSVLRILTAKYEFGIMK